MHKDGSLDSFCSRGKHNRARLRPPLSTHPGAGVPPVGERGRRERRHARGSGAWSAVEDAQKGGMWRSKKKAGRLES